MPAIKPLTAVSIQLKCFITALAGPPTIIPENPARKSYIFKFKSILQKNSLCFGHRDNILQHMIVISFVGLCTRDEEENQENLQMYS